MLLIAPITLGVNISVNGIVQENGVYTLTVDTSIYSVESVKKALYKFADRTSGIIQPKSERLISIAFNFSDQRQDVRSEDTISEFCNELLDQSLREIIKKETAPVRNLILAHAFSQTTLIEDK